MIIEVSSLSNYTLSGVAPRQSSQHLPRNSLSSKLLVLVRDEELVACGGLVLVADGIGDGLVLGLLSGALVALVASTEELLLDKIDSCQECISTVQRE